MASLAGKESEDTALESRGYTLGKKLGQGSYAKVRMAEYRAGDKVERLACKIVDKNLAPKDFLSKFFPRELDVIPKMDHPSVIRVHSILERNMKVYIFMQCAENGDLLEHIQKNGVIPEARTRAWLQQMISGLIYLHNLNICHRDLKCENVLITKNHNLKIADLGFARYVVDAEGKRVLSHTYCGSAAYAAPEVVKGTPYNPKMADVWSMGVIVYIMVNASMPFDDSNLNKMLRDQLNRNWSFRSKVRDKMSADLKTMITRMIEPDLTKRYTADQVQQCEWMNRS